MVVTSWCFRGQRAKTMPRGGACSRYKRWAECLTVKVTRSWLWQQAWQTSVQHAATWTPSVSMHTMSQSMDGALIQGSKQQPYSEPGTPASLMCFNGPVSVRREGQHASLQRTSSWPFRSAIRLPLSVQAEKSRSKEFKQTANVHLTYLGTSCSG